MAQKAEIRSTFLDQTQKVFRNFWGMSLIFLMLMLLLRVVELYLILNNHVVDFTFSDVMLYGFLEDLKPHIIENLIMVLGTTIMAITF